MNVSLTPELEKFIADRVKSGMYHSASEVVREALRLLREQDELKRRRVIALREAIGRGLDQLDRGEAIAGEQVLKELKQRSAVRRRARA